MQRDDVIPAGGQGPVEVQHDSVLAFLDLDAVAPDLVGATMDTDSHAMLSIRRSNSRVVTIT